MKQIIQSSIIGIIIGSVVGIITSVWIWTLVTIISKIG